MKWLAFLCLILAGCVSRPVSTPPTAPNVAATASKRTITTPPVPMPPPVSVVKRATGKRAVAAIIIPPPIRANVLLSWNYGTNRSMTAVYFATDLAQPMTLLTNTADTNFVAPLSAIGFFQVVPIASVELGWDASLSTNVTNYKIYWGTATGNYTSQLEFGSVTNATVFPLTLGITYFFAATAVDALGNESVFSNEAVWTVPTNQLSPMNLRLVLLP